MMSYRYEYPRLQFARNEWVEIYFLLSTHPLYDNLHQFIDTHILYPPTYPLPKFLKFFPLFPNKMNSSKIKENQRSRGYSFGVFQDLPKQVWSNFVHKTNELVVLAEGEIEVEIEGKAYRPEIGEEVFIPANASQTVRNIGSKRNVWYYGYKKC